MADSKHTPGPLHTEGPYGSVGQTFYLVADQNRAHVAGLVRSYDDAKLFAAAPDMYEALLEAIEGVEYLSCYIADEIVKTSPEFAQRWVKARAAGKAALAKARA